MANPIRVAVVADTASMQAELGAATRTLVKFGETSKVAFGAYSESALRAQVASDKLAVSLAKVPAGSAAAAAAVLRYGAELDAVSAKSLAAQKEIGMGMSRYITAPVLVAAGAAVDFATKFQSHMLLIQTQAGASAAEVKKLSGEVLALAKGGAQQGPVALADGLFHLESVGLRGKNAMMALKVASNAAALGMANLEDVSSALAGAITSNIKGAQNYQQAMGTLNAIIGAGNMHMTDLLGALSTGLLPKAKNAGVSLTEVGAALAVLTDRGMTAEQAATRLGQTFAFMEKQTPTATKALADMGVDAGKLRDTIGQPNGLLKVLQMLADGMASVGKTQGRQDIISAFGGGRSSGALITLVQSLSSSVSSYQGKVQQITQTTGNLAKNEAAQQRTASAQFHKDLAAMEADLIQLGNKMLPAVTAVVNGVTKIGNAFSELPGPIKDSLGIIVAALAVGGPLLLALVGVKRAIITIGTEFGLLPARAAPGIAATDAEIATIGATADMSLTKVSALRSALLGLGGADVIAAIVALGGVLASSGSAPNVSYPSAQSSPLLSDFAHYSGGIDHKKFPELVHMEYLWLNKKGVSDAQMEAYLEKNAKPLVAAGILPPSAVEAAYTLTHTTTRGPAKRLAVPAALAGGTGAASGGGPTVLTPAQQLEAGLYLNPNDVTLLRQKLADDEKHIAESKKLLSEGKINATKYLADLATYGGDAKTVEAEIAAATSKVTSAANKKAAEARKKAAAEAKAQREYASGVSTHASGLRNEVERSSTATVGGNLSAGRKDAYDALIEFYKAEARDSKLTAAERSRYGALAIAARKKEIAEAVKFATDYERIRISNAKTMLAKAKLVKGNVPAEEKALHGEIAAYAGAASNKHLTGTQRATYRTDEATAKDELANLRNTYTTPVGLQLDMARDTALNNTDAIARDARRVKAAVEKALKLDHLTKAGMIQAWQEIANANQILGTNADGYHDVSSYKLTQGLGLTRDQRRIEEARYAQAMQHQGRKPIGLAADGFAVKGTKIEVHSHTYLDGSEIARNVQSHQLHGGSSATRTGRLPGVRRGLA